MWPHMKDFIRAAAEGGPFVEIRSDMAAQWKERGMPSTVVPGAHEVGGYKSPPLEPRIQSLMSCCRANRWLPLLNWAADQRDASLLLHGQRASDHAPIPRSQRYGPVQIAAPLWDWSEAEVLAHIAERGIALPPQYAEGVNASLECWACTAPTDAGQLEYLRRHMPERYPAVRDAIRQIQAAVCEALTNLDKQTRPALAG
jgi:3'-phosphoadenosine 5'-phosphosulfate sulfotransferase (PAPS reductase)/FAD synthetase